MLIIGIGVLIFSAFLMTFVGNHRKNERLIKIGMSFSLVLSAILFLYCQNQFSIQRSTFERERQMTALSLFFAMLIAMVWGEGKSH